MTNVEELAESSPIDFLLQRFAENAGHTAFVCEGRELSYAWLLGQIRAWLSYIRDARIDAGQVVALTGDYSPEVCSLLLSLVHTCTIVVPFASVSGGEKAQLARIANVQADLVFEGDAFARLEHHGGRVENPLLTSLIARKAPGLVVFSSGSAGTPKAILHDVTRILDKFRVRRKTLRSLVFLQLDHLGGINTLLYVLSNGGTVISLHDRAPRTVCAAIERYRIELLPVTPSFLHLLIASGEHKTRDLSSLRVITYGTEVMPQATLDRVRELFPGVLLQQTYGLSELGVLRTKSREDGSLWVKVGGEGFQTKVVDEVLWIKAESAMLGYLNAPQPFDADGWFNTEDRVEVDGEYLRILGRNSEIINVAGQKVFPSEVENLLIQVENVKDAVVRGEKNVLVGSIVVATLRLVRPEDHEQVKRRVKEFCRERLSAYKIPQRIEITDDPLHGARFKRMRNRTR